MFVKSATTKLDWILAQAQPYTVERVKQNMITHLAKQAYESGFVEINDETEKVDGSFQMSLKADLIIISKREFEQIKQLMLDLEAYKLFMTNDISDKLNSIKQSFI